MNERVNRKSLLIPRLVPDRDREATAETTADTTARSLRIWIHFQFCSLVFTHCHWDLQSHCHFTPSLRQLLSVYHYCRYGEISGMPETIAAIFIAFVLNITFALSVTGFLIMHISLGAANATTIEACEKKRTSKWPYDLGWKKNFEQVFGTDKKFWFFTDTSITRFSVSNKA